MNTSVKLAQTLASQGATPSEILSVLENVKGERSTPATKAAPKAKATPAPKHANGRGAIAAAIAKACPSKGQTFTTKELVAAALAAGSKNLPSASQAVNVFLNDMIESKSAKRTGRGTYVTL